MFEVVAVRVSPKSDATNRRRLQGAASLGAKWKCEVLRDAGTLREKRHQRSDASISRNGRTANTGADAERRGEVRRAAKKRVRRTRGEAKRTLNYN